MHPAVPTDDGAVAKLDAPSEQSAESEASFGNARGAVRKSKANAREGKQTVVKDRTCPNDGRLRSFYVMLYDRSFFRRFRRRRAPCASFPSGLTPWRLSLWRPLAPGAFRLSLAVFCLGLAVFCLGLAVFCLGLASLGPRRFR